MRAVHWWLAALVVPVLAACQKSPESTPATDTAPTPPPAAAAPSADTAAIDAAIANPNRLAGDSAEDAWRRPAEVLAFLQVRPGMTVLDYFSAAGYYTELLSNAVGPQGKVIAYNNEPYLKFSGEKPGQRYGNNRLPNVTQVTAPVEEAAFDPASVDAALFMMSYHDLYWRSKDGSWPNTDPAAALARLVPALKPGAIVVVMDHVAADGSDPATSVDAMHRIDPAVIKRDFEAAGLVFEEESQAFRNPQDDHTKQVFDESIRHKTDQVLYRFRKK
jgi:predicted methyltransferase